MKLQQLRYVCEVVRSDLNLSKAALMLHTSQPGISKQIIQLEDELGVKIFVRAGKRLTGLTEPGQQIFEIAQRILLEARNLKEVTSEFHEETTGQLVIATTHTQARYVLPPVVQRFREAWPQVRLALRQGSPTQIAQMVLQGEADLAIATEALDQYDALVMLPVYEWNRCAVMPAGHPLLETRRLTLKALARWPIITYDFAFTGRSRMNRAFEAEGLVPDIVLTAIDADVIKTYVSLGMGVGIIAHMAFEPDRDTGLRAMDASHLFEPSVTRIGLRRNAYLRGFVHAFVEMFAPHLTRAAVETALAAPPAPPRPGTAAA
ncbi:MAG: HTH-type transcriptional regulator CysB [Burkholderiales bacterium]|nr:HTH-type transcriptional regulator CysB [Burkholderiales bacterium]